MKENHSVHMLIRLKPGQLENYQKAADIQGMTLSKWARFLLDISAKSILDNGVKKLTGGQ